MGWSLATFRVFFLAGAVLNVPWLALGTVYLLAGERIGDRVPQLARPARGLAAASSCSPRRGRRVAATSCRPGKDVFGVAPRVLAAVGLRRRRAGDHRRRAVERVAPGAPTARRRWPACARATIGAAAGSSLGNVLIAAGTIVLSASGTLAGRLGKDTRVRRHVAGRDLVLFAGFLVASSTPVAAAALHAVDDSHQSARSSLPLTLRGS